MTDERVAPSRFQTPIVEDQRGQGAVGTALATILTARATVPRALRRFIHDRRMLPVATPRLIRAEDDDNRA